MLKYRNKPTNGYHSRREADLGANLQALQRAGKIRDLGEQVKYQLIPKQAGKLRNERPVSYIADFVYSDEQGKHVVDAKGMKTPDYVIKRKLMLERYGIEVEEL